MPHGTRDFGNVRPADTIFSLQDLGELAARLDSIDKFERAGNVLYLDGFENGLVHVDATSSGTGGSVDIDTTKAKTGAQSCKMTTGSTGSRLASIKYNLAYPVASKMGFEFSFIPNTDIGHVSLDIFLYTGSYYYNANLEIYPSSYTIQIYDENFDSVIVDSSWNYDVNLSLFHVVKLVLDFVNFNYERLILNNDVYDLTDYGIYRVPTAVAPKLYIYIKAYAEFYFNAICWVDDVIITQNET